MVTVCSLFCLRHRRCRCPSCTWLRYLAHSSFFTVEQFLEVFDDPMHVVPVTDLMWPHIGEIPLS